MEPGDLTLRPITGPAELGLFNQFLYVLNAELADDLADGRRRPEWMWLALRGGRPVARAAWWTRAAGDEPFVLDVLDVDDALPRPARLATGVRLLRTAMAATLGGGSRPPGYGRFVPPDWRDDAATAGAVRDRMTIAERTGGRLLVERLRLEWRPGTPVPDPTGRLLFRPVADTGELLALMTLALDGTLDAHHRADMIRMSPRDTAVQHYEGELALYRSPREWWRIATLPGGEPVGFVLPARNPYNPIIAYLAVLPAHRGNGYIDDILAEGTRVLAGQDVSRIGASTDLGNVPMANAFRRAGYVNFGREINMVWD
jgi:RimJ/RimL family protein N-acetyltransferase